VKTGTWAELPAHPAVQLLVCRRTAKFNVFDCLVHGLGHADQGRTIAGTQEQYWSDIIPAATND